MMDPPEHMDLIRDPVCISCKGTRRVVPSQSKHSIQHNIIKATALTDAATQLTVSCENWKISDNKMIDDAGGSGTPTFRLLVILIELNFNQ